MFGLFVCLIIQNKKKSFDSLFFSIFKVVLIIIVLFSTVKMSEENYTFMRSGLVGNQGTNSIFQQNIAALVMSFSESSLKLAKQYVEHKNGKMIATEHVQKGLATYFFRILQDSELEMNFEKWVALLRSDSDTDSNMECCTCSSDSDNEEVVNQGEENEKTICKVCNKQIFWEESESESEDYTAEDEHKVCNCDLCIEFDNSLEKLRCYEPIDDLSKILRNRILQDVTTHTTVPLGT